VTDTLSTPLEREAPRCLYTTTARPAVPTPPLRADVRTQVAIVGAGYTGLSAALHLAERGVAVTLLEAHEPGWGAAGRNGGQVNAGLKHEPDDIERRLGGTYGPRLVQLAGEAPARLFALIDRFGIDCEARREGTLRAAYQPRHVAALHSSVSQWRRRDTELETWDAERIAAGTGTRRYLAASFDPRGGSVNPLGLARGLAAAALSAGATIHGETRAQRLERAGGGWRTTDGYSDELWPGLRTSIVPVYSSIIASQPLPATLRASILPGGGVVYENGNVTTYYRLDRDGRLLMGGRGAQRRLTERAHYEHLRRYALRLWPALVGIQWTHWWNGQFAMTPDYYPRVHAPAENVLIGLGYSGRGVALGVALGAELAAAAAGANLDTLAVPATPVPHIPLHALWRAGVTARVAYGRLLDTLGL
jgi:glycine/D-amino acid oxidase-like deaminating enzyme